IAKLRPSICNLQFSFFNFQSSTRRMLVIALLAVLCLASPGSANDDSTDEPRRPAALAADKEPRWLDSLARGYTHAQRRQKPIFVKVGSATCKFCRELA